MCALPAPPGSPQTPALPGGLTRRGFLRALLGVGAGGALLGGAGVAQAYRFEVVREGRALPGLRAPLRVAFLTDLHYGPFIRARNVRAWVAAANAERPDVVLLGGDYLDVHPHAPVTPLLRELAALRAPLGVWGVWGNHDYGSFGRYERRVNGEARPDWAARREELRAALAGAGVTLLRNEGAALRDDVFLGGVDDLMWGEPDLPASLRGAAGRATLLLSHNPDLLPQLPGPVGAALCGHTHGGQVRLPLLGAPLVPSRYGQRYAMGWVTGAHGTPAYVSRGLGVTGVPLRNLCPPEVTLLTFTPT